MQELRNFLKSAQNCASFLVFYTPGGQFRENEISTLIRGRGTFLEDKRSNQVERNHSTYQKCFFIN
jgi:hypothetical protein